MTCWRFPGLTQKRCRWISIPWRWRRSSPTRAHVEQINRDNHLEVRWDIDRSVPPIVTDPIKLEEILQNLIGNAFKFTFKGRVEVRVRNLRDEDRIQFIVADTGIGIETENLVRIFNEFEQVKEAH